MEILTGLGKVYLALGDVPQATQVSVSKVFIFYKCIISCAELFEARLLCPFFMF